MHNSGIASRCDCTRPTCLYVLRDIVTSCWLEAETCSKGLDLSTEISHILNQGHYPCYYSTFDFALGGSDPFVYTWLCDFSCGNVKCNKDFPSWFVVTVASAWIASLLYITCYVWNSNSDRLALTVRLFVTPLYSGPLLVSSMLLNRRRFDREIKVVNGEEYEFRDLDSDSFLGVKALEDGRRKKEDCEEQTIPMVYACATLWHETDQEMKQLLKSIFRMDMEQCARKLALTKFGLGESDYYEFETHCFFDDAWIEDPENKGLYIPNRYVMTLLSVINGAASGVYETEVELHPPEKVPTPYGGQLVWNLPGGNKMVIHLKDKNKIRHKKRWSQVMYMYYLLGWKLLGNDTSKIVRDSLAGSRVDKIDKQDGYEEIEKKVIYKAENTFLLVLDGDVDFKPEAVVLLIDRLKRNPKTGGACGRIHPIGSGPVVWYQIFEYAIGHWMQKATEDVFGCVLCSPGCFSLFRGSTLMDTNIMCRYTTKSTEPVHFLQYDQGEDRWLSTLVVQQGYRIDYCAGADALTYAPVAFNEFFNQRRRWITSTLANVLDLLASYRTTVYINDNISLLYMFYQLLLTVATLLGPSTIIIAIASSLRDILVIHEGWALAITLVPTIGFIAVSLVCKEKTQLICAAVLSLLFAIAMVVVFVGILKVMVLESILAPSAAFVLCITFCFLLGGLLHPYEFSCLAPGLIYFLCIPAGYLVLTIYSFSNMHVVSWGTRETPKPVDPGENEAKDVKKKGSFGFSFFNLDKYYQDFKETFVPCPRIVKIDAEKVKTRECKVQEEPYEEDPMYPEWAVNVLKEGDICHLCPDEWQFWEDFIRKYVKPLKNLQKQQELKENLVSLRNSTSMALWFLNGTWILFNYMIERAIPPLKIGPLSTPPLGFVFLSLCLMLIALQLIGMIVHRWHTFLQLIANTVIPVRNKHHESFKKDTVEEAVRITKMIQQQRTYNDDEIYPSQPRRRSEGNDRISSFLSRMENDPTATWSSARAKFNLQKDTRKGPIVKSISRGVEAALRRQAQACDMNIRKPRAAKFLRSNELESRSYPCHVIFYDTYAVCELTEPNWCLTTSITFDCGTFRDQKPKTSWSERENYKSVGRQRVVGTLQHLRPPRDTCATDFVSEIFLPIMHLVDSSIATCIMGPVTVAQGPVKTHLSAKECMMGHPSFCCISFCIPSVPFSLAFILSTNESFVTLLWKRLAPNTYGSSLLPPHYPAENKLFPFVFSHHYKHIFICQTKLRMMAACPRQNVVFKKE
uniref:chitin synthase n=1 Tax=Platynereis dumerilii TaxID=6359 RepID=A0A023PPY3_PLADU|nr:chitin synthase [Platynereis dumerilii]